MLEAWLNIREFSLNIFISIHFPPFSTDFHERLAPSRFLPTRWRFWLQISVSHSSTSPFVKKTRAKSWPSLRRPRPSSLLDAFPTGTGRMDADEDPAIFCTALVCTFVWRRAPVSLNLTLCHILPVKRGQVNIEASPSGDKQDILTSSGSDYEGNDLQTCICPHSTNCFSIFFKKPFQEEFSIIKKKNSESNSLSSLDRWFFFSSTSWIH